MVALNVAGCRPAEALKPERSRDLVRGKCADWAVSIRRRVGPWVRLLELPYHESRRTRCPAAVFFCKPRQGYGRAETADQGDQ